MSELNSVDLLSDLITPEESANLMSKRAGYRINQDDIKQLRHHGKIKAAKQFSRTTLYKRSEIEQAPLPKKHHPQILNPEESASNTYAENTVLAEYKERNPLKEATWRTVLNEAISEPYERQRVASVLGISSITLTRWITNRSQPRPTTLRLLLDTLPQYREQLASLIEEEYPYFVTAEPLRKQLQEIPSTFYAFVHEININSPPIVRRHSVIQSVFHQMLSQLDSFQIGLSIFIAQCVPPISGKRVRSLRKVEGLGTGPWEKNEHYAHFFGNESYVGHATLTAHPTILLSKAQITRSFPAHYTKTEKSAAVYPILLSGRIAGSLCVTSTQSDYFSQVTLDLIKDYVNLITIAFDQSDFYNIEDIELGLLPSYDIQQHLLATFQQRVRKRMVDSTREGKPLTHPQAELQVWQDLEKILLDYSPDYLQR